MSAEPTALVLAPSGRDGAILRSLLAELGLPSQPCGDVADLVRRLGEDTSFVVLTEEAVRSADLSPAAAWIEAQPPWSDLPFVVLTRRGGGLERNPAAARLQGVLGNVSFVERPFHPTTLASAVRVAERGRRRQYEARARLEALREGEARLQRLADTLEERVARRTAELVDRTAERDRVWRGTRDLYVTIDRDGCCRAANPAWEREMGHAPADLIGTRFDELVHPEDRPITERRWIEVLGGTFLVDHEIRVRTADGAHRWYSWTVFEDGDVVVAVGRDVEERRAREAELRAAEEALRQSQKLEMIGQLTGGVAHDFNNLLMAVQSNVELAGRRLSDEPDRARELLANALQGVARGASLTQRMLAFARKQDLAPGPVDVAALVAGMSELLGRSLGPGVEIESEFAPGVPPALVDANQLEMAVLNLAVNARDAMAGEGRLSIALDAPAIGPGDGVAAGRHVRLRVRDEGVGMDAPTLARAAEPFFTTKEVGRGTGLGLSMIHGLAEQSGGSFRLESEPGVGTTAEILLPVAPGGVPAAAPGAPGIPGAVGDGEAASPDRRLTVLAVDDDALVLMGTVAMLEDLGHDVLSASSGPIALGLLADHEAVDVVLTDQAMPAMTGTQLARRIKSERPQLPIVLATGYADRPKDDRGLFAAQLGKPFEERHLERVLAGLPAGRGRDGPRTGPDDRG